MEAKRRTSGVIVGTIVLLLLAVVVRCAWVSDDAYTSFRTVDNLVNGYGLTWNVAERVQAFTNPLWVLLMAAAYAVTSDVYYTCLALSVLLTAATAFVLVRFVSTSARSAALVLIVLMGSKAFVDYSTSGLENPLTHLLLAIFLAIFLRRTPGLKTLFALCLIAALGAVNRLDTILLYLPTLLAAYMLVPKRRGALIALAGFAPLLAWEIFSIVYYGFPLPNTYYAKLHAGVPTSEIMAQGLLYFLDSLDVDPVTLIAMAASGVAIVACRLSALYGPISGAALYLVYVVGIGGDFMSGRFFAAPLLVAMLALSRFELPESGLQLFAPFAIAAALALASPRSPLKSDSSYGAVERYGVNPSGIADERGYYYQSAGLLRATRGKQMPSHLWLTQGLRLRATGAKVEQRGAIGFAGFAAGPGVRILDVYGLADPLVSRLRIDPRGGKRIGHFERRVPKGYFETLESGENRIADPSLARYYEALHDIVAGPVWSAARFGRIAAMNTGGYDHLLDAYLAAQPGRPILRYAEASQPKRQGTRWDAPGNSVLGEDGLEVELPAETRCARIEVSVDNNDDYELLFLRGADVAAKLEVPRKPIPEAGLRVDEIAVPAEAVTSGYDTIAVRPASGDGRYALGHLRLLCAQ